MLLWARLCCVMQGNRINDARIKRLKRKFHDFITLLTSTEKLLTQAEFELAPLGTPE